MALETHPPVTAPVTRPSAARGITAGGLAPLEAACVELICELESGLAEATEFRALGHHGDASEAGKQMLLGVLDFAEENLQEEALQAVRQRVADAYDQSKQVDDLVATRSWAVVRRMFGMRTATEAELVHASRQLGEAVGVVVVTAVAGCAPRFDPQSSVASQITDSLQSFIDQLRTGW